jgi:hypothetical protein
MVSQPLVGGLPASPCVAKGSLVKSLNRIVLCMLGMSTTFGASRRKMLWRDVLVQEKKGPYLSTSAHWLDTLKIYSDEGTLKLGQKPLSLM